MEFFREQFLSWWWPWAAHINVPTNNAFGRITTKVLSKFARKNNANPNVTFTKYFTGQSFWLLRHPMPNKLKHEVSRSSQLVTLQNKLIYACYRPKMALRLFGTKTPVRSAIWHVSKLALVKYRSILVISYETAAAQALSCNGPVILHWLNQKPCKNCESRVSRLKRSCHLA